MLTMLAAGVAAALSCPALPGFDQLLARPDLGFVLIGEYHGTVEMPAIAGDAACAAVAAGRPVILGVELTPADQPAIDAFMASDGGRAARAALTATPGWQEPGGRSTAAIADLIDRMRQLAKRHPVTVLAFDVAREPRGTSPRREAAMAAALDAARARVPDGLVVALTGVGHADKEGFTSATPPFLAAAGHLPAQRTVSLAFARPGGSYWGCASPAGDGSGGCKAYAMPAREPLRPRGVTLDPTLRGGFDGVYSPGRPYAASRPARGG
jgi:hypothetical protein